MATVNKDFKIKSGLIVEGTNATVNGNQILTETASDQYILDLIGGETLVKSVSSQFDVSAGGELSLDRAVVDAYYDAAGDADAAETAANTYTDNKVLDYTKTSDLDSTVDGYGYLKGADLNGYALETYVDQAELDANSYTDGRETAITTAYQSYADTAEQDAKDYADGLINDASTSSTEIWSAYKTSTEIGLAQAAAELHADNAVADLVNGAPALLDTLNELAAALQDNPDVITDLQDIAAGKQDTLTAGANIDITGATISVTGLDTDDVAEGTSLYFTDSRAVSAVTGLNNSDYYTLAEKDGKAGVYKQTVASTLASDAINGSGISTSVTNNSALAIDRTTVDAWYDASGTAQGIVDALDTDDIEEGVNNLYFTDGRAKSSAADLLLGASLTNIAITGTSTTGLIITAENGVADSTTTDLAEGTNLYFTDVRAVDAIDGADITPNTVTIDTFRKEEATHQYVTTASTVNVHSLSGMYESVKYLVRVVGNVTGTRHSQLTEILLTTDGNGNIALTEYGTIHTSESPLATFSATMAGGSVPTLTATTLVANTEIIAAATMLSWAD